MGLVFGRDSINTNLVVSHYAGISASLTAVISLISYIWINQRKIYRLSLVAYLLMAVTSLTVIGTTGDTGSPFIALWMLVVVFCGLYGWAGVVPITTASLGYLIYITIAGGLTRDRLVVFLLAFVAPIAISYTIWHRKSVHDASRDRAYSELAQELSQVANKSEVVIQAIADGVLAIDGRGIIQLINPAAQTLLGWPQQDALGLDYRSVLRLSDSANQALDDANDPVQHTLRTGQQSVSDKFTVTSRGGKNLIASLHISPLGAAGAGAIIVFRDITTEVEEGRQQAEFISTASHEMRTPVAAIEGFLSLALNPATAAIDQRAQVYLTKAHDSAQHLGRLFQDLLDVTKIDDGRLRNNPTVIDVVASARDITNSLMMSAQQKGLVLIYKPDADGLTRQRMTPVYYALIDNDHFRETLSNLIENAIKYTKAGDVSVDVDGDDEHVTVSVSDTGIGIPREDVPHLFQKFYRVDNSDTREIGGTGLGLYLSRRLVETMGGRLWVESEYGKGSTFYVSFGRISHEEAMTRLDAQATAAAPPAIPLSASTPLPTQGTDETAAQSPPSPPPLSA